MLRNFVCFLIIIGIQLGNIAFGAIPTAEREALIALYNTCDGDNWTKNSGWKTPPLYSDGFALPGTEGNWTGITVSENHVTQIDLISNNLSGNIPSQLESLSNLQKLWLAKNHLNGSIPSQLGNLNQLLELWLGANQLTGTIPSQLGNLDNLEYLGLYENQLNGEIPAELGNLSKLRKLVLSSNQLSGVIPYQLGNLTYLYSLLLDSNQLTGAIPSQIGNLINMQSLVLDSNKLSGNIPAQLGNLTKLKYLWLNNNQLSGSIPSEFGNFTQMEQLLLYANQLSGNLPPELGNLTQLEQLLLSSNKLTGSIPSQLGNLTNCHSLLLEHNRLSGNIPPELGSMYRLEKLWLECNELTGNIPSQLGNLPELYDLRLDNNQLSGNIPSELGNIQHLITLNLSDNQLSGSIPSEFGNLDNLRNLYLSINQLNNTIPSQLGNLTKLQYLDLDQNLLSGEIPSNLKNLNSIIGLDIGYNCLSASDSALITWLNTKDPDWDSHQNQCNVVITIPTVTTGTIMSITSTGAIGGGNVTSDGNAPLISRGVCWSTSNNPTVANSKTNHGGDIGTFSSSITGLNPGTVYHVRAYATNRMGTAYGSEVSFTTTTGTGIPVIELSHTDLAFGATPAGAVTGSQSVVINNTGSGVLNWRTYVYGAWITLSPTSGTGNTVLSVSVNPQSLTTANYNGKIEIYDSNATNAPQVINVTLHVFANGQSSAPFGEFATPLEGSTLSNSIPVTGWVLDDIGVSGVKIYNGEVYIGDAVFVEGARPDVEVAYPTYPNNYKAGWGYMLLTHFLPGGGNGSYTLIAKATDVDGHHVTLGTKTITVNNSESVKPFGAIDTPTQGGKASGSAFIDWGWVLTPQPNKIPVTGQTISVYVDGVKLGHPVYNIYREDIAALFPGYFNSNGAAGYFALDTTKYENGNHTISWVVVDDTGNSDGIGSRYFSIENLGNIYRQYNSNSNSLLNKSSQELDSYPVNTTEPIGIKTGISNINKSLERELTPDVNGVVRISLEELEILEIRMGQGIEKLSGFMVVDDRLRQLPTGSTLEQNTGTFYWQPGPGYLGTYQFQFLLEQSDGKRYRCTVEITVTPLGKNSLTPIEPDVNEDLY